VSARTARCDDRTPEAQPGAARARPSAAIGPGGRPVPVAMSTDAARATDPPHDHDLDDRTGSGTARPVAETTIIPVGGYRVGRPGAEATHPDADRLGCAARRLVLLGLGSAGLVVLTGCGGERDLTSAERDDLGRGGTAMQPGETPPTSQAEQGQPAPGQPAPGGAAPTRTMTNDPTLEPWPTAGAGGLVRTSDVPVGGGVLVNDLIVVQPQRGTFKAYDARCPHQGIIVDPPPTGDTTMSCPAHSSRFRVSDGSRISGPTPSGLRQVPVRVQNGYVVPA